MKQLLFVFVFFFPLFNQAQEKKQINRNVTIRGNVGIQRALSSQKFRTAFNGVVEGALSVNLRLKDNFFAGVGYQYTNFINNKELFVYYRTQQGSLSYKTHLIGNSAFVKLGYDYFFSDIGYVTCSLNSGFMFCQYQNVVRADTLSENQPLVGTTFNAPYVQPELAINFLAEKSVSFSILLGYTTLFYKFDPKAPRFNQVGEISSARNNYYMSWINIGFGFNILLGK